MIAAAVLVILSAPAHAQTLRPPLSLEDAIGEALSRNTEISAAVRAVDVARAQRTQVALPPLQLQPSFSLGPDVPGGVGPLQTAGATITQQFLPPGNLSAARSQAEFTLAAATFGVGASRRDIALRTASAYYTLAGAQATVEVSQQNVSSTEDFVRSAQLRARAGAVGSFEVLRANVELRRVQVELLRAQAAQGNARIALNTLLGRSPDAATVVVQPGVATTTSAPATPSPTSSGTGGREPTTAMAVSPREPNAASPANVDGASVESLSARAVAADPALQQLQAQISAQAARARASAALRRPALTLGAGYQIDRAVRSGAIFGAPVVTSGIAIPIFDRGTISGAVREAEATRSVLEAQAQGRTRQVQAEVASAAADIAASSARFQFAQASRVQAEEGLRIALFGFRQGALGSLDVLSAKNAAASARGEERQAADDLAAARARLRIILGVSTTS